jgi:hypothetical protein
MVEVNQKSRPAIEGVGDSFAQFALWQCGELCLIEPSLESLHFRLCQPLAQVKALSFWEGLCKALDIKEAFDDTHGQFCRHRVRFPGIFEVAVDMSPAVCGGSTVGDYLVVLIGAIGLKDAFVAFEDLLRVAACSVSE